MLTISTTEMKCYRTILGTSYVECITNDTVWDFITQEAGPMEDFIFIMKGKCYGHVIRTNSLSTTILQSSTLGKRNGRQSKKKNGLTRSLHGLDNLHELRHWYSTEGAGHVLSCSVTLQSDLVMGLTIISNSKKSKVLFLKVHFIQYVHDFELESSCNLLDYETFMEDLVIDKFTFHSLWE